MTQGPAAVALIPLTLWLAGSLITLTASDYNTLIAWLKVPFLTILMVTGLGLQMAVLRPLRLGKDPALVANTLRLFALAVVAIFATLRIAFDG